MIREGINDWKVCVISLDKKAEEECDKETIVKEDWFKISMNMNGLKHRTGEQQENAKVMLPAIVSRK